VETGSREENASKQRIEPGFDSIKTEMALSAADPKSPRSQPAQCGESVSVAFAEREGA
jgi:hypothetical protein